MPSLADELVTQGVAVALVRYRLSPEHLIGGDVATECVYWILPCVLSARPCGCFGMVPRGGFQ